MTEWTRDELNKIGTAEELESLRADVTARCENPRRSESRALDDRNRRRWLTGNPHDERHYHGANGQQIDSQDRIQETALSCFESAV